MISEPNISQSDIQKLLEETYGFKVNQLTFLPKGEASWGYIVDSDRGKYFFKIYKGVNVSDESFKFTRQLHDECGIKNINFPQLTKSGELKTKILEYPAVLFNFIDGKTEKEIGLNESRLVKLGEIFALIHKSGTKIGALKEKETFEINDKEDFDRVLAFTKEPKRLDLEPQQKAFELIQKKTPNLLALVNELSQVADKLKKSSIEFVNCHGDPTQENILISPDEEIYLIDWDEPISAPKERDLLFFTNESRFPSIAKGYSNVAGECVVDERAVKFYKLSWTVQEVADFGSRLFFEEQSLKQNEHNYEGLEWELKEV